MFRYFLVVGLFCVRVKCKFIISEIVEFSQHESEWLHLQPSAAVFRWFWL